MNNAFAKNNKEQELLLVVYENLLEALEKSKTDSNSIRAKFFIDIESQIRDFEEEHPEFIFEYYYEKEYDYNE